MNQIIKEVELDDKQQLALDWCCDRKRRVVSVTGQAGTGKTQLIQRVYRAFTTNGAYAAVAAPTGKAARRIRDLTGIPAVTLHKLLEYDKPRLDDDGKPTSQTGPKRDRYNPLVQDVVIVDEYAMVNRELHRNLIDALPHGGLLRAFGDVEQLPPIEPYEIKTTNTTPFQDLLALPSAVTLEKVYRQLANSGVLEAARQIRRGLQPMRYPDFQLLITTSPVERLEQLLDECHKDGVTFDTVNRQIISPSHRSFCGTYALNVLLQNRYMGGRSEKPLSLPRYKHEAKQPVQVRVGDKVICNENTYDMRDYLERFGRTFSRGTVDYSSFIPPPDTLMMLNGESGVVTAIHDDGSLEIDVGDRTITVPAKYHEYNAHIRLIVPVDPRRRLSLGYAVTTHRAQGSEYDTVVYIMNKSMWVNVTRNNFYTAVTRGRQQVYVITDMATLKQAVQVTSWAKEQYLAAKRTSLSATSR